MSGDMPHEVSVLEAWGFLGTGVSNNVAEYHGLIACLDHALEHGHVKICVQTDSMLIAKQVNFAWACRCSDLRPLLAAAWRKVRLLAGRNVEVVIEHIYRRYNKVADALANHAVDTSSSKEWATATVALSV